MTNDSEKRIADLEEEVKFLRSIVWELAKKKEYNYAINYTSQPDPHINLSSSWKAWGLKK